MRNFNFVYLTICKSNGKCYVGSHCTDREDLDINRYFGGGDLFKIAFKKYGKSNFLRIVLKQCSDIIEARNLERIYIELFDTIRPNGYNISPSGGMDKGMFGNHSEESKLQMSRSRAGKEPWNKGKTGVYVTSEETKKILRTKNLGENNAMYGKKGKTSPIYGIHKSSEHRENLGKAKLGSKNPNAGQYEIIDPSGNRFSVLSATDFIKEHPEYGINRHFLYGASKTKKPDHKGWKVIKI